MESVNNVEKKWRTRQEKEALIDQWLESGQSRKVFCAEHGLSYYHFVSWDKEQKVKAKTDSGFTQVWFKVMKDYLLNFLYRENYELISTNL